MLKYLLHNYKFCYTVLERLYIFISVDFKKNSIKLYSIKLFYLILIENKFKTVAFSDF